MNSNTTAATRPPPTLPRPEYPRPTLVRERWLNLNGEWGFAMDPKNQGLKEVWQQRVSLPGRITVPFPVEAEASGIGHRQSAQVVWYHRSFENPEDWDSERLLLHIGASDHWTRVFINGQEVGQNEGGYAPFAFDIAHAVVTGSNHISIRVEDSPSWSQPRGKQEGTTRWPIDYDGVTGIWQTVWLEPVPATAISDIHSSFDLANFELGAKSLRMTAGLTRLFTGHLEITIGYGGSIIARTDCKIDQRSEAKVHMELAVDRAELPLWSPATPRLCDVTLILRDQQGNVIDEVKSYLGLRQIAVVGDNIHLNGEPLYIRGILDQGYFPGGWYTALTDDDFRKDIELTKSMGFNCARKHQKAEDPRYLYWADRLGLLVWAEMPSGRIFSSDLVQSLTTEWLRLIRRDRVHPSVVAWVPFNESWGVWNQLNRPEQRAFVDAMVSLTRSLDTSRPVIGNDGWEYSSGDLWTLHLYEGDATPFADRLAQVLENPHSKLQADGRVGALEGASVKGLPVLLTECGGIGYQQNLGGDEVFAYGDLPDSTHELERRIRAIASDIQAARPLRGFVWTQLTDVQQEKNGLLTFEREPKLPVKLLRAVFTGIGRN